MRDGAITPQDIITLNERVVAGGAELPENIRYATYYNRDRDAINAALFEEHCAQMFTMYGHTNDATMVFSNKLKIRNGSKRYVELKKCHHFWETCGEDNIKMGRSRGRMDPVLRLYQNCRVMLPTNTDVKSGQANGTQATFEKLVLKRGVTPQTILLSNGTPVRAVLASQVDHIRLIHCNDRINPKNFTLEPKACTFTANILKPAMLQAAQDEREPVKMQGGQLPLIINNATTGHKLQGSGVDCRFVHS